MKHVSGRDIVDDAAWQARFEAICTESDAILATEGEHHVRGLYFASTDDATTARIYEAERRFVGERA